MSTRCQVMVYRTDKKFGHQKRSVCPKFGKKFFHVKSESRWHNDRAIGICEAHLKDYGDPMQWKTSRSGWDTGYVRWITGKVTSFEEVSVGSIRDIQRSQTYIEVKNRLKTMIGYKSKSKLSREEWQDLFQEALDEFCIETVMGS